MSDLEPDWDSPLSLSLTPAAIFSLRALMRSTRPGNPALTARWW